MPTGHETTYCEEVVTQLLTPSTTQILQSALAWSTKFGSSAHVGPGEANGNGGGGCGESDGGDGGTGGDPQEPHICGQPARTASLWAFV